MANQYLSNAKRVKNDEFYTQFIDIQREMEAYLEYDSKTFKGKVVYCNCDDPYESNFFRYFVLNFKKLGLKRLITTSYKPSPLANTQLGLFGDDSTLPQSKGRPKVNANQFIINKVHDYAQRRVLAVDSDRQAGVAQDHAYRKYPNDFPLLDVMRACQEYFICIYRIMNNIHLLFKLLK